MCADVDTVEIASISQESKLNDKTKLSESFDKHVQLNSEPYLFGNIEENQKASLITFHNLLSHFHDNPTDLLELPIIHLTEESRQLLSPSELQDDDILRNQVGDSQYNNSNFEEWFAQRGFDPNFLLTKIDLETLKIMENFSNSITYEMDKYSFDKDFNEQQITLKKALEIIRVQTVGELYLEETKERALETISKHAPELIPKEPIETIFDINSPARGAYIAFYKGKHYLAIQTSLLNNPYLSSSSSDHFSLELDESIVIHEIIHVKQGEIIGCKNFFQLNQTFDEIIPDSYETKDEIVSKIHEIMLDDENHDKSKNFELPLAVYEGEAVMGQLLICGEKISHTTSPEIHDSLRMVYDRSLVNRLRLRDEKGKLFSDHPDCNTGRLNIYRKGFDLIHPLQKEFGVSKLLSILSNIDFNRLSQIKEESDEAKAIFADPRLLPGLENSPDVIESLRNNPIR